MWLAIWPTQLLRPQRGATWVGPLQEVCFPQGGQPLSPEAISADSSSPPAHQAEGGGRSKRGRPPQSGRELLGLAATAAVRGSTGPLGAEHLWRGPLRGAPPGQAQRSWASWTGRPPPPGYSWRTPCQPDWRRRVLLPLPDRVRQPSPVHRSAPLRGDLRLNRASRPMPGPRRVSGDMAESSCSGTMCFQGRSTVHHLLCVGAERRHGPWAHNEIGLLNDGPWAEYVQAPRTDAHRTDPALLVVADIVRQSASPRAPEPLGPGGRAAYRLSFGRTGRTKTTRSCANLVEWRAPCGWTYPDEGTS